MIGILIGRAIKSIGKGINYNSNLAKLNKLVDKSEEWYTQYTFNHGNRYFFKISDKEYIKAFINFGVVTNNISKRIYIENLQKGKVSKVMYGLDSLSLRHLDHIEPSVTEVKSMMETIKSIK